MFVIRQIPINNDSTNKWGDYDINSHLLSRIFIARHTLRYRSSIGVKLMLQINDRIEDESINMHELYKKELDEISRKYFKLQKEFEAVQLLELNLRYENYQLREQLKNASLEKNAFHQSQEQKNNLKAISILLGKIDSLLNESFGEAGYQSMLNEGNDRLHRPSKEKVDIIGLGKELLLKMKDSHETNENNVSENKGEDQHANEDEALEKELDGSIDEELMETKSIRKMSEQDDDPVSNEQGMQEESIGEKKDESENEKEYKNKEIKGFHELRDMVHEAKLKSTLKKEQPVKGKTIKTTTEQNNAVENHSSSFTFRDLQNADYVYAKPFSRKKIATTTSVNRKMEENILIKKNEEEEPEIIHDQEDTKDREQEKKLEESQGDSEFALENSDDHQEKQIESNKNEPQEDSDSNEIKIEDKEQKVELEAIDQKETEDKKQADRPEEKEKVTDWSKDDQEKEESSAESDQTNKDLLTNQRNERLNIADDKSDQEKLNEPARHETNRLYPKQVKNESFFKSIWKKIMKK